MVGKKYTTIEPDVIRRWAEMRRGTPVAFHRGESEDDKPVLGFAFPSYDNPNSYEEITWQECFNQRAAEQLVFLYQEKTETVVIGHYNRFVSQQVADEAISMSMKAEAESTSPADDGGGGFLGDVNRQDILGWRGLFECLKLPGEETRFHEMPLTFFQLGAIRPDMHTWPSLGMRLALSGNTARPTSSHCLLKGIGKGLVIKPSMAQKLRGIEARETPLSEVTIMANQESLDRYRAKRNFHNTTEPTGQLDSRQRGKPIFVIQQHDASHLHYDFRLEVDGVLKSWAVPKGPSTNPREKRLAVPTEDHPIDYADFEGLIPKGEYGAGTVRIWDRGTYQHLKSTPDDHQSIAQAIEAGKVIVWLEGDKLIGGYALVRMPHADASWLLIKMRDDEANARRHPANPVPTPS